MFVELDESVRENVSIDDDSKNQVKDKGNILIRLKNGRHKYISNNFLNMKNNNLSVGQLLEKGYVFT